MERPLVTVIIPAYNSEKYIGKCLDGVLLQTYRNLQVVVVDDGSSDATAGIVADVNDARVEYYRKSNGGASSARNFGLKHRRGKYVLFVDSDDSLKPDAVEILVDKAEESCADCVYYEAENKADDPSFKVKKDGLRQSTDYPASDGDGLIAAMLENKNYHAVPFLYFVKSEIYDGGLSFEEGIMFEDELFSFELLRLCRRVVCLRRPLYIRNVRAGSVMTSRGKGLFRFKSIATVYERLYDKFTRARDDRLLCIYLSRIAMLWLGYWEQLTPEEKKTVSVQYRVIKKQILDNKGFGRREVSVRCHGRALWYIYIAPGRAAGKVMKKLRHG